MKTILNITIICCLAIGLLARIIYGDFETAALFLLLAIFGEAMVIELRMDEKN